MRQTKRGRHDDRISLSVKWVPDRHQWRAHCGPRRYDAECPLVALHRAIVSRIENGGITPTVNLSHYERPEDMRVSRVGDDRGYRATFGGSSAYATNPYVAIYRAIVRRIDDGPYYSQPQTHTVAEWRGGRMGKYDPIALHRAKLHL